MVIACGHEIHCFAMDTALACERPAIWRIETAGGDIHVCDRHRRLAEIRAERAGWCPRPARRQAAAAGS